MSTSAGMRHLEARLETTPTQTLEGVGVQLAWRVEIGPGPSGTGPAGVATLVPPGSGLRVLFDYARPGRLLGLWVPCGVILDTADETLAGSNGEPVPRLTDLDAAVLDMLVGWEVRSHLQGAGVAEVSALVAPAVSWATLGRLGLLQTVLADDPRPLDGLWAAEAAALVARLDRPGLRSWAERLVTAALPALQLLPESWAGGQLPPELLGSLVACARLAPEVELGPLARACRQVDEAAIEAALAEVEEAAWSSESDWGGFVQGGEDDEIALAGAGLRGDQFVLMGGAGGGQALRNAAFDYSALDTVRNVSWELTDGQLRVEVTAEAGRWPSSFASRVQVRATTHSSGLLVAAGLALGGKPGHWHTTLRLPFEVDPDDLFVCVGRHLPVEAITAEVFRERQARTWERERLLEQGERPKLLAEQLAEQLGELVDTSQLEEQLGPDPGERSLAGARSLAWCAGRRGAAARFEVRRLEIDGPPELTLEQADRLIAAAATDNTDEGAEVADKLDERVTEAYYDLLA